MPVIRTHTLEENIVYEMVDKTLPQVAKHLQTVVWSTDKSVESTQYIVALKAYLVDRINAM
jgi:hypothetical protein